MDAWSRSDELQSGDTANLIGVWVLAVTSASERGWEELQEVAGSDAAVVARLGTLRGELVEFRAAYTDRRPADVAAAIGSTRGELASLREELSERAVVDVGAAGPVLVELVSLQSKLNDEAVLLAQEIATGIGSPSEREALLVSRARSDLSLDRVRLGLAPDHRGRLVELLDSDEHRAWDELHRGALSTTPDDVADRAAADQLGVISEGTAFVTAMNDLGTELFEAIGAAARTDGEQASQRRDLVVSVGLVVIVLAVAGAVLVGRALARRIRSVAGVAARVSAGDLAIEPLDLAGRDEVARLAGAMDEMVLTLRRVNGQLGALAAGQTDDPALDEELPGSIGRSLRSAIRRLGRSTEELKRRATHDALTGLLDRDGLDEVADSWDAHRTGPIGVVVLDLDGFKQINDDHGHGVGDELLRAIATRLSSVARSSDVVGRIGGDEFVVLLGDGVDAAVTEQVSNRLVHLVCQPITVGDVQLEVGASVGWVLAEPGTPASEALGHADAAMYRAKRAGKGRAVRADIG